MTISRRGFLRGLLALPLVPRAAEQALKVAAACAAPAPFVGVDWVRGSDQTSIWLVRWAPETIEIGHRVTSRSALPAVSFRRVGKSVTTAVEALWKPIDYRYTCKPFTFKAPKNWFKEAIRGV